MTIFTVWVKCLNVVSELIYLVKYLFKLIFKEYEVVIYDEIINVAITLTEINF